MPRLADYPSLSNIRYQGAGDNTRGPKGPARSSYLHPIYGLDGEVLTDDFPKDHDYHRGLYWAWPHSCRYRLWIHREVLDGAEIQKAYDAFSTEIRER